MYTLTGSILVFATILLSISVLCALLFAHKSSIAKNHFNMFVSLFRKIGLSRFCTAEKVEVTAQVREYEFFTAIKTASTKLRKTKSYWEKKINSFSRLDPQYKESGVIGLNIENHNSDANARASNGDRKKTKSTKSNSKGDDGGAGSSDPDDDHTTLLLTKKQFAQRLSKSTKTVDRAVQKNLIPPPLATRFGLYFTKEHLDVALSPPPAPAVKQNKRGRPRIAARGAK